MNHDLALLLPEWTAVGLLFIFLVGEITPNLFSKHGAGGISLLAILLIFFSIMGLPANTDFAFNKTFIVDRFSLFFKAFFTLILIPIIQMSRIYFRDRLKNPGEFFLVLWTSLAGLFLLVSAYDLLVMFIALEIFTIALYIMIASLKENRASTEAGLKYLILGSVASAFFIFGTGLIYFATGSTGFEQLAMAVSKNPNDPLMRLGVLFILSALGFKIASVPFHLWAPDVYEGAPTPVVAYLSVGSKAAGFAVLIRLLFAIFIPFEPHYRLLFSTLAGMTLIYGNLGALLQTNIKRLLGYSSIGHAGYMLIGLAVGSPLGTSSILYYLMAYAFTNFTAFLVISQVSRISESDQIDAYRGLGKRSPFLAGVLFVALLSLAGVPPLAGFFAKFLVLLFAIRKGLDGLVFLGALFVAVSLYYYLGIVKKMYFEEPHSWDKPINVSPITKLLLILLLVGIFLVGLGQGPLLQLAEHTANLLN